MYVLSLLQFLWTCLDDLILAAYRVSGPIEASRDQDEDENEVPPIQQVIESGSPGDV